MPGEVGEAQKYSAGDRNISLSFLLLLLLTNI